MTLKAFFRQSCFVLLTAGCAIQLGQSVVRTPGWMSVGTGLRVYLPFLVMAGMIFAYSHLVLNPAGRWPAASATPWLMKGLSLAAALLMSAAIVSYSASAGLTLLLFGFFSAIACAAVSVYLWAGPTVFYGFYASLLLLPLLNWLSSEFPQTPWREMVWGAFSVTPVILLVMIAALAASVRGRGALETLREAGALRIAAILFLISGALAVFQAPDLSKAIQQWFIDGFLPFLGLWIVLQTVHNAAHADQCLDAILFCAAGVALLGGYLFFRGTPGAADIRQLYGANLSVNLPSANLAQCVLLLLPVSCVRALQSSGKRRVLFISLAVLFFATILFSYSRSSTLAMGVSLLLLAKLPEVRRGLLICAAAMLLFALVRPTAFQTYVLTRLTETQDKSVLSDNDVVWRMEAWRGSLQLLKEHPWGVGLGQWSRYAPAYTPSRKTKFSEGGQTVFIASPHNILFNFGIEAGWLGLGSLVFLFASVIVLTLRPLAPPLLADLHYAGFAGATAYILSALVGANLFAYKLNILPGLLFWSFIGWLLSSRRYAREARA